MAAPYLILMWSLSILNRFSAWHLNTPQMSLFSPYAVLAVRATWPERSGPHSPCWGTPAPWSHQWDPQLHHHWNGNYLPPALPPKKAVWSVSFKDSVFSKLTYIHVKQNCYIQSITYRFVMLVSLNKQLKTVHKQRTVKQFQVDLD